jgi:hypothetical protein
MPVRTDNQEICLEPTGVSWKEDNRVAHSDMNHRRATFGRSELYFDGASDFVLSPLRPFFNRPRGPLSHLHHPGTLHNTCDHELGHGAIGQGDPGI